MFILRINLCQNVLEPADFDGLIMPGFIYLSSFENALKVLFIPINNKSLLKNLYL